MGKTIFTDLELDALREICSMASGRAASSLSKLLGTPIDMNVPSVWVVPFGEVLKKMGSSQSLVAGIYLQMIGDVPGNILITFPFDSVGGLLGAVLGEKPAGEKPLSEMGRSALKEIGNIVAGSFVTTIAAITGKNLIISVPRLAIDMAGAIVDSILIELAHEVEEALVMEVDFHNVPATIRGQFYIMPNRGSLNAFREAIRNYNRK